MAFDSTAYGVVVAGIGSPATEIDGGAPTATVSRMATLALISRRTPGRWTVRFIGVGSRHSSKSTGGGGVPGNGLLTTYGRLTNFHNPRSAGGTNTKVGVRGAK